MPRRSGFRPTPPDDGTRCRVCGLPLAIGDYPCVTTIRPHASHVRPVAPPRSLAFEVAEATDDPLDAREMLFVAEYLIDFQGARAARAAGYSKAGAKNTAYELIRRPRVQEAIEQGFAALTQRAGVTAERVLRDIDRAANVDIADLFDADGCLRNIHDLPAYVRRCIQAIEVVKKNVEPDDGLVDRVWKVKLIPKDRMHEILAKYTGLTREDAEKPVADVPAFALPPGTKGVSVH